MTEENANQDGNTLKVSGVFTRVNVHEINLVWTCLVYTLCRLWLPLAITYIGCYVQQFDIALKSITASAYSAYFRRETHFVPGSGHGRLNDNRSWAQVRMSPTDLQRTFPCPTGTWNNNGSTDVYSVLPIRDTAFQREMDEMKPQKHWKLNLNK